MEIFKDFRARLLAEPAFLKRFSAAQPRRPCYCSAPAVILSRTWQKPLVKRVAVCCTYQRPQKEEPTLHFFVASFCVIAAVQSAVCVDTKVLIIRYHFYTLPLHGNWSHQLPAVPEIHHQLLCLRISCHRWFFSHHTNSPPDFCTPLVVFEMRFCPCRHSWVSDSK